MNVLFFLDKYRRLRDKMKRRKVEGIKGSGDELIIIFFRLNIAKIHLNSPNLYSKAFSSQICFFFLVHNNFLIVDFFLLYRPP